MSKTAKLNLEKKCKRQRSKQKFCKWCDLLCLCDSMKLLFACRCFIVLNPTNVKQTMIRAKLVPSLFSYSSLMGVEMVIPPATLDQTEILAVRCSAIKIHGGQRMNPKELDDLTPLWQCDNKSDVCKCPISTESVPGGRTEGQGPDSVVMS